jgi:hypothetical protein
MAEAKGGMYITFEGSRREKLQESALTKGRFSIEMSASDWNLDMKDMFLMSLSEEQDLIECAAIGRRKGGPRNTGAYNIEFTGFVFFTPVSIAFLTDRLPWSVRVTIKDRERGRGKWFPPVAWAALLESLERERPEAESELNALWDRVNAKDERDHDNHTQRLAMQRDAIGLSLDMAGLAETRRQEFRKIYSVRKATEAQSFIGLMDALAPQERMLVDYDRSVIENAIAKGNYESMSFSHGQRSLRVWTVDRGEIERFAGVDLVILNRDYNSLLLLQYKCMELDRTSKQWSYRPDRQFDLEMSRMKMVDDLMERRTTSETQLIGSKLEDIRLHRGALYFKLCKRLPLSQQDGELADGMVVSLPTAEQMLQSGASSGLRGGRYIGYENCNRYLSNSLFSALARDGWIGSQGLTDRQYMEVLGFVQESDNHSLVLAESKTIQG